MKLEQATAIAERVKAQLAPHCDRIEIAGSVRRRKPDVGDIHVLACGWCRNGYKSHDGMLSRNGAAVPVREERDLFRLAGVPWVEPEARSLSTVKPNKENKPK